MCIMVPIRSGESWRCPLDIQWFRDLSIAILGLVSTVVLIVLAIVGFYLYREVRSAMASVKHTSDAVHDTIVEVREELVNPLVQVVSFAQLIKDWAERIAKVLQKPEKEGEKGG